MRFLWAYLGRRFDLLVYRIWLWRWRDRIEGDEVLRHTLLGWLLHREVELRGSHTLH